MATNSEKLFAKLQKHSGAVTERHDVHARVVRTSSPSTNATFGNGWGVPRGFGVALYGPPKGGKTLMFYDMVANLHREDPTAYAVKYDTEFRDDAQLSEEQMVAWGIDPKRYICYQTNAPEEIFDHIADEGEGLYGMIKEGLNVGLVGIDSVNGIRGRRSMNAKTIGTQQIGDNAMTIQEGLKWIMAAQKRGRFALVATAQIRAEMDQLEQMRGNKVKMAAAFGMQHHFEYFMYVEPNRTKDGKTDLLGNEYKDEDSRDAADNAERTAHRIRVCMKDSSLGPKGRIGEFTFDYRKWKVTNVHEEVFKLGVGRGVIERPNQLSYEFGGKKWSGKDNFIKALRDSKDLQTAILKELMRRDLDHQYDAADAAGKPGIAEESAE